MLRSVQGDCIKGRQVKLCMRTSDGRVGSLDVFCYEKIICKKFICEPIFTAPLVLLSICRD